MTMENNNRGAIWGNAHKKKDTHPDFTGNAIVDGVEYKIAAWKRKPQASAKAPSLTFKFEKTQIEMEMPDADDL